MQNNKVLLIRQLNKQYGNTQVLFDIDLTIDKGEVYALLGPNGSGKSTLIRCILGLAPFADQSAIAILGQSVALIKQQRNIGYMPQQPNFPANMTVKDIISFINSISVAEPIYHDSLSRDLGISAYYHKRFADLSQGMKQKVNILQCFMYQNVLTILDEPTASLDPQVSFFLKQLIRQRQKIGESIVITSHVMSEVEELATRMSLLLEGRIVLSTSPTDFIATHQAPNLEQAILDYWR